eukprot:289324_1
MELTHNVFQKNVCRARNIAYSQYRDYTPRTSQIKGFVGDINSSYGRYGVYGQCRTHSLLHSMTRTKSHPTLNFETKSGYTKTRRKIGRSNRLQLSSELKSYRKYPLEINTSEMKTKPIKRKEYQTNSITFAIKKRKKLGIKVKKKKRPKSCPGYNGATQRS